VESWKRSRGGRQMAWVQEVQINFKASPCHARCSPRRLSLLDGPPREYGRHELRSTGFPRAAENLLIKLRPTARGALAAVTIARRRRRMVPQ
jgi:hypothetical protein